MKENESDLDTLSRDPDEWTPESITAARARLAEILSRFRKVRRKSSLDKIIDDKD